MQILILPDYTFPHKPQEYLPPYRKKHHNVVINSLMTHFPRAKCNIPPRRQRGHHYGNKELKRKFITLHRIINILISLDDINKKFPSIRII